VPPYWPLSVVSGSHSRRKGKLIMLYPLQHLMQRITRDHRDNMPTLPKRSTYLDIQTLPRLNLEDGCYTYHLCPASHTIQLQCQQGTVNLGDSLDIPCELGSWRLPSVLTNSSPTQTENVTPEEVMRAWRNIITIYSQRTLMHDEEKLTDI
jgi:hypothetical protein